MILFFSLITCNFIVKIIESTPSEGKIKIKHTGKNPNLLIINFPSETFPYLHEIKNVHSIKQYKKYLSVVIFNQKSFNIKISFDKTLKKNYEYAWDAERGYKFPKSYLLTIDDKNEFKLFESEEILDMIYVPDFTVPFLAFNTCCCVFSVIYAFVVKRIFK